MSYVLSGNNDFEKLACLSLKTYKEQAVWFLNAFWDDFAKDQTEKFWDYVSKMIELDPSKKGEGTGVDELNAHRFLESFNETMTVRAMRDGLRSTGAIKEGSPVRLVPLIHILIFKFSVDWHTLVNAPQGSKEEIEKAQRMLDEVNSAFEACEARDREAAEALQIARDQENAARQREEEARQREAELLEAQQELETALAELKAQEDEYNQRTQQLQQASETGGLVSRNKAKNELAQHLSSDPLPLRRAKITQEASVKKAEKATRAAADARAVAAEARVAAENARARATQAKQEAEDALDEARKRVEEAEAYLEEAKSRIPHGTTWWLERELYERKKYLPKSKGGVDK